MLFINILLLSYCLSCIDACPITPNIRTRKLSNKKLNEAGLVLKNKIDHDIKDTLRLLGNI